jgi:hypothetical protein
VTLFPFDDLRFGPPNLPKSIEYLGFKIFQLEEDFLDSIVSYLERLEREEALPKTFELTCDTDTQLSDSVKYDATEEEDPGLFSIANFCIKHGIELRLIELDEMCRVVRDEQLEDLPDTDESEEEEEPFDYDAEEGEEWRHWWSGEKLTELAIREYLSTLSLFTGGET